MIREEGRMCGKPACRAGVLLALSFALAVSTARAAVDFDYRPYESLLHRYLRPHVRIDGIAVNAVDYAGLTGEAGRPGSDYNALRKALASFDPGAVDRREEKIAFWINVYNIAAMKTIVDDYPVDSIRSRKINWLGLPWDRKAITVGGKEFSLAQVENDILMGLFQELRIHFGINCASVSCVNLRPEPYRGGVLYGQLEDQARQFLADPQKGFRLDREKRIVFLSQIFKFARKDFDRLGGGPLNFILPFLNPADREWIGREKVTQEYLDYDWRLNDRRNVR